MIIKLIGSRWHIALIALLLAFIASILEGVAASLVLPLLQFLGGNPTVNYHQLPNFIKFLLNIYLQFETSWQVYFLIISLLIITIIKNIVKYFSYINIKDLKLQVGLLLRQNCIEKILKIELPFYNQHQLGELLSYVNEHAMRSEILAGFILEIASDLLTIFILISLLFSLSTFLTIVAILNLIIVSAVLTKIISFVRFYGIKSAKAIENFSSNVTEIVVGIRTVKEFTSESRELDRAKQVLQERYEAELRACKYNAVVPSLTETVGIAVLLLLLALGSSLLSKSQGTSLAVLLTHTMALLRILPRISHVNSMRSQISLLSGSLEAIYNFLSRTSGLHLPDGTQPYEKLKHELAFENVTFTYSSNSEPTLRNISFPLQKGTTTAIVGPSGSGKSTLADLVMRFHDPDTGSIKVDGLDLREFKLNSWRQAVAMVSQDTFLFNASVRENIAYGCPEATELEILEAAKKAYAYEFVKDLPQGFDTIVGNRGTRLSGGQRQRIAIARAILRNPDILVLDEATSALDSNSERIVQKALEQVSHDRTVMVIAHRLSTIEKANNIVVLSNGRVVEQGTHQELLALQGKYWSLYKSQAGANNEFIQSTDLE